MRYRAPVGSGARGADVHRPGVRGAFVRGAGVRGPFVPGVGVRIARKRLRAPLKLLRTTRIRLRTRNRARRRRRRIRSTGRGLPLRRNGPHYAAP
ncbi:hypothetical protein STRIP9103_03045 [Streptomyces ipomoeae 91-03]|uniref:Uncharacterized protein n=1 Tax=Streptomyces ipomoeae 91-03 TaxID=698759 RepID=L1KVR1_9ACTN|nr:hypothetical protein STRIP9103_03045 [Streptomyces ipomoeae 91-03]